MDKRGLNIKKKINKFGNKFKVEPEDSDDEIRKPVPSKMFWKMYKISEKIRKDEISNKVELTTERTKITDPLLFAEYEEVRKEEQSFLFEETNIMNESCESDDVGTDESEDKVIQGELGHYEKTEGYHKVFNEIDENILENNWKEKEMRSLSPSWIKREGWDKSGHQIKIIKERVIKEEKSTSESSEGDDCEYEKLCQSTSQGKDVSLGQGPPEFTILEKLGQRLKEKGSRVHRVNKQGASCHSSGLNTFLMIFP